MTSLAFRDSLCLVVHKRLRKWLRKLTSVKFGKAANIDDDMASGAKDDERATRARGGPGRNHEDKEKYDPYPSSYAFHPSCCVDGVDARA
ncbi:Protein of unknown function, partial [Gryllus bimaculatus]